MMMLAGNPLSAFPGALVVAARRFNTKGGWVMSSHVAMSVMLALFPFLLFVVSFAGLMSRDVSIDEMSELIFGAWPDSIAAPIEAELRAVLEASGLRLMTVGGLFTLYFASNGVDAVRVAMSVAYREVDTRSYWQARLLCLGFVLLGTVVLIAAVAIGVALPLYFQFVTDAVPEGIAAVLTDIHISRIFGAAVIVAAVGACHKWLPGTPHKLSQIWPGVVLTVVLWAVAGRVLSITMAQIGFYSATYAGLAGAMTTLIFLYLLSAILIFGSEYNGALIKYSGRQEN